MNPLSKPRLRERPEMLMLGGLPQVHQAGRATLLIGHRSEDRASSTAAFDSVRQLGRGEEACPAHYAATFWLILASCASTAFPMRS